MSESMYYVCQSVTALALVLAVIYLALQRRETRRILHARLQHARADSAARSAQALATPELAAIFQAGCAGETQLSRVDFRQWMMICRALFISSEDTFQQHRAGVLDKSAFDSQIAGLRTYLAAAGMRAAWELSASQFGAEFRAFVDELARQAATQTTPDAYAEWHRIVQPDLLLSEETGDAPLPK